MARRTTTPANPPAAAAEPVVAQGAGGPAENVTSHTSPRTNKTVTVACKMPHGIVIRDHVKRVEQEPVFGSSERRNVEVFRPVGPRIRIKGPTVPSIFVRLVEVVGDYAITEGVPADVFERWMDWNKDSPMVLNKLIYGHENGARVRDWAKDHGAIKSGLEPLDVTMKTVEGRQVYGDERVRRAGADQVVDGAVKDAAA